MWNPYLAPSTGTKLPPLVVGVVNLGTYQGNFQIALFDPAGGAEEGDYVVPNVPDGTYLFPYDYPGYSDGQANTYWWDGETNLTMTLMSFADSSYEPPDDIIYQIPNLSTTDITMIENFPNSNPSFAPAMFDASGNAITTTGGFHGYETFKNIHFYATNQEAGIGTDTIQWDADNNKFMIGLVPWSFNADRDGIRWGELEEYPGEYGWIPDYGLQSLMRALEGSSTYPLLWYPESVYYEVDAGVEVTDADKVYRADGQSLGEPIEGPYIVGLVKFPDYEVSTNTNYTVYLFPVGRWESRAKGSTAIDVSDLFVPCVVGGTEVSIKAYAVDMPDPVYTVTYLKEETGIYSVVATSDIDFFDKTSEVYYKTFASTDTPLIDIELGFPLGFFPDPPLDMVNYLYGKYIALPNGNVGRMPTVAEITGLSAFDLEAELSIMALNGITDIPIINLFAQKCHTNQISLFIDAPAFDKFKSLEVWQRSLFNTEYASLHAVPDKVKIDDVTSVYVWPSINMVQIYANMFNSYGTLNYVPAGNLYGNIAVSNLITTDYYLYADALKTKRINYQKVGALGPVMWEQRTRYALESDLSYISTVFILRELKRRLLTFFAQFTFRYTTPAMLLNLTTGLASILQGMQSAQFLVGYRYQVPSYAEAQAAGRLLVVKIWVSVISDAEEIEIQTTLENAATLSG
jgi:hypothetical protein